MCTNLGNVRRVQEREGDTCTHVHSATSALLVSLPRLAICQRGFSVRYCSLAAVFKATLPMNITLALCYLSNLIELYHSV